MKVTPSAWTPLDQIKPGQIVRVGNAWGQSPCPVIRTGRRSVTVRMDGGEFTLDAERSPIALYPVVIHGPVMAGGEWSPGGRAING